MALPIINVCSLDETIETKLGFLPEWQKKHNQLLKFQISLCVMIPPAQRSRVGEGYIGSTPSVRPACHVGSVTPTVLDQFFPY